MKVSIITLHNIKNYGSVLQTYATQKKFENLGVQAEFVDYWRQDTRDRNVMATELKHGDWNTSFIRRICFYVIKWPSIHCRKRVFNAFLSQHIHLTSQRYYSIWELSENPPQADIYCTGSDQVWNSINNGGIEAPYFLEFAPKGKPCVAYSASFGKEELSEEEKSITSALLQKYSGISVREKSGIAILNDLGIAEGVHVLDPTLAITQNDWKELIGKQMIKRPYLLIYQLNPNKPLSAFAKKYASEHGLKLIRLSYDWDHIRKPGHLVCCPKVEGWLSLFYYADYIVTDSFHGTAFSINFNKSFSVFNPPAFNTRIQSLLELTGLENRIASHSDFSDKPIDYTSINSMLSMERKKADTFLKRALLQGAEPDACYFNRQGKGQNG